MSRSIVFAPYEIYHLYNRGTEKRKIFQNKADYQRFMILLYLCNQKKPTYLKFRGRTSELFGIPRKSGPLVEIAAYCLMPNHFHIICREIESGGISKFMQKLLTAYTMYFNAKYERTGVLFQGKFKAEHATTDRYLMYLISYLHLNPVALVEPRWKVRGITDLARAERYLDRYAYSSYADYCGGHRPESAILQISALPKYFKSPTDFKRHVTVWLRDTSEVGPRNVAE